MSSSREYSHRCVEDPDGFDDTAEEETGLITHVPDVQESSSRGLEPQDVPIPAPVQADTMVDDVQHDAHYNFDDYEAYTLEASPSDAIIPPEGDSTEMPNLVDSDEEDSAEEEY